ncbi:hypothetical protein M378DRAFT_182667, partial [Amanita muscaria Koide BX008]
MGCNPAIVRQRPSAKNCQQRLSSTWHAQSQAGSADPTIYKHSSRAYLQSPKQLKCMSYPSYPPPPLEFQPRDFGTIVETLAEARLTFDVAVEADAPQPWRLIDQHLRTHLENSGYRMPLKPGDDGTNFNRLSWDLVTPGKVKKDGAVPLKSKQVFVSLFTTGYLNEMAIPHPERRDAQMLILADRDKVPLQGNLLGPISPMGPRHACFPWHLMASHEFVKLSVPSGFERHACIPGCCPGPHDDEDEGMENNNGPVATAVIPARRSRSPSPSHLSRITRIRRESPELEEVPLVKAARLSADLLHSWQKRTQDKGHGDSDYSLNAASSQLPAAFIHLVRSLMMGTTAHRYQPESTQVQCYIHDKAALLTAQISPFGTGLSNNAAVGNGPARSTYHGALEARVKDSNRWNTIGDGTYHTLNLSTESDLVAASSLIEYQVDGALIALAMVHLISEPCPISPFLIYAASFKDASCLRRSPEHVLSLTPDRQTRRVLSAILEFKKTDLVQSTAIYGHDVASRAIELGLVEVWLDSLLKAASHQAECQINHFQEPREEGPHQKLTLQLLSLTLLGHTDLWSHRRFQAFCEGINLKFLGVSRLLEPGDVDDPPDYQFQLQFLSTLYDGRIKDAHK